MKQMINAIDPDIEVTPFAEFFPTMATVEALRHCDLIVACVDRLQVRDDLNRFCKRYLIPLIDVGIEITPDRDRPGAVEAITGRVTKVMPAGPCLRCQGIIDDEKLAAERGGQPLGYTGAARVPDPAVVTLNGIVASAAATEVLQQLTGFAGTSSPNCGWIYDGLAGTLERATKVYRGCDACRYERGLGDI
jgi:molybdopterin-synthase adenylyltransferase